MIPFSPPYITQEAIDEVVDTLKSGWITTGPKTKKFEKEITEYCGNKSTLCVNSATFGLELILKWFGVKPGDEVIVPAYTYTASVNVIVHTGAKPVLVDVNQEDFNISVDNVKKAITSKTKVIIPVDIAGLPANYNSLNKLVNSPDIVALFNSNNEIQEKLGRILILSDAAHSFGALYNSKKAGALTDISVFSFHAVKNLTTAEGGAIALNLPAPFNNDNEYNLLNTLSLHGQNKDALAKSKIGGWRYDVIDAGYKGNMTDIQASLGLIALKSYESTLKKRREIVKNYQAEFSKEKWAITPILEDEKKNSSYHLYTLRIDDINEKQRDEIIQLIFENKISVNVHFIPIPMLSAYKEKGYKIEDFPIAYKNFSQEISLPVYESLSDENVNYRIKKIKEIVNNYLK